MNGQGARSPGRPKRIRRIERAGVWNEKGPASGSTPACDDGHQVMRTVPALFRDLRLRS